MKDNDIANLLIGALYGSLMASVVRLAFLVHRYINPKNKNK